MGFFIDTKTYEREVISPDGDKGQVTLRKLNAGDQAAIQDTLRMRLADDGADTSMLLGTMRMITVERAVVDWSWPGAKPSPEAISQLEPEVFEQIYSYVEIGSPPTESQNGSAPEETAASSEKTRAKSGSAS
jgi:hypothetical protein